MRAWQRMQTLMTMTMQEARFRSDHALTRLASQMGHVTGKFHLTQLSSAQGDSEEDNESMAGHEDDRQHVKKVLSLGIMQKQHLPMSAPPPAVMLSICVGTAGCRRHGCWCGELQ